MTDELRSNVDALAALLGKAGRNPPVGRESLRLAEARLGVDIPDELLALLEAFDGGGPTDVEHGWITLWPADEFERGDDGSAGRYDLPGAIVFADHGTGACWYALQAGPGPGRGAVLRLGGHEPEPVAPSLAEFLRAVVEGNNDVLL